MMPEIPSWFPKKLRRLDPDLKIVWNEEYQTFEIWKTLRKVFWSNGKKQLIEQEVCRAAYDYLNDDAMTNLEHRAWIGRHIYTGNETDEESARKYERWLRAEERETKQKEREKARDMVAQGIYKSYKMQRGLQSHSVS